MKPAPLFYIQHEGTEAGPYDVVQMAGLLRRKIIDDQTPTRREDEDAWKPFSWHPQFVIAREMPADAVSERTSALDEAAAARKAGLIPKPSPETLMKVGLAGLGILFVSVGAFALVWINESAAIWLGILGLGVVALAQAMIVVRMLDEDTMTLAGIYLVPFYDVYYLICNLSIYARWLALKYAGAAVMAGAAAGLATHR